MVDHGYWELAQIPALDSWYQLVDLLNEIEAQVRGEYCNSPALSPV